MSAAAGGDDARGGARVGDLNRLLLAVVGVLAFLALLGVALLWPRGLDLADEGPAPAQTTDLVDARLVEVVELAEEDPTGLLPGAITVDVTAELDATGERVTFPMTDDTGETFEPGQRVRLQVISAEGEDPTYLVVDFRRERPLLLLTALFVVAVVAFGRFQGVRALLGLALTFALIVGFIVPAILAGRSPVAVALVGAVLIMIITLYLSHGYSRKTTAAVVGTAAALVLTGLLAGAFASAANLTGFASEEARLATLQVGGLSLRGLLLAGIIIGGLGVLDDVTMSQSSTVFELHRANPSLGFDGLLRGALSVGRDHIAATVNTLFLAYAGAALPLLILFVVSPDDAGTILTSEIVAVEVVRTLVGSLGLIAAVPVTTALAAAVVVADPAGAAGESQLAGGHHHGAGAGAHKLASSGTPGPATAPDRAARSSRAPASQAETTGVRVEDEEWVSRLRDAYRLPPDEQR